MGKHYIFGYGSLINTESREKTGKTGTSIPVNIKNLRRYWSLIPEITATGVVITQEKGAQCNGILVPIAKEELPKFDKREKGYQRIQMDLNSLEVPETVEQDASIWAYVIDKPLTPTQEAPIEQSYLDVILTGCLHISEAFARTFISTTAFWHSPWINDRANPRYPRALEEVPQKDRIDSLLKETVSKAFANRIIEK